MSPLLLVAALMLAGASLWASACGSSSEPEGPAAETTTGATTGQVEVVGSIPHAGAAWTEGFIVEDGVLWESTGRPTGSGVRAIDPGTGDVLWSVSNGDAFFAEGIVRAFGRTYVLSYQEGTVFEFDRSADEPFTPFASYEGEGWGLTAVGDALVNSNGSSDLFYRDPDTFEVLRTVPVRYQGSPVERLNELEYDGQYLWANQWQTPYIYRIDEADPSQVVRYELPPDFCPDGQPNGIAWDEASGLFYVAGQTCQTILKVVFH
jgi:glutamine cyclotransferase